MKPHHIFLLLWAVFITGLSDGLAAALMAIPGVGFVLGLAVSFSINATMGVGLILALSACDMYHPRISPFTIIGGLIPGLNLLPFWVALVIAGIVYKINAEKKSLMPVAGVALSLQENYASGTSPVQKMRQAFGMVSERRATGRPPHIIENAALQQEEAAPRSLPSFKSPAMNNDIEPAGRPPQSYAKIA